MTTKPQYPLWRYSEDALLRNDPMKGGSRSAFFIEILLANAEGKINGTGIIGIYEFLNQKCGIERKDFEKVSGLKRFVEQANRVWQSLERQFNSPDRVVEVIQLILERSRGELSYLHEAARREIGSEAQLDALLDLIGPKDIKEYERKTRSIRKFKRAIRLSKNDLGRFNEPSTPPAKRGVVRSRLKARYRKEKAKAERERKRIATQIRREGGSTGP